MRGSMMLKQEEVHYIKTFLLKKGEYLEMPAITKDILFIDIKIIKQTERTRRVTGILTIAVNVKADEPCKDDEEILKRRISPRTKLQLQDHDINTIRWFEQGWIIKEIRFKKDGKTPESQNYRIGYRLYQYQEKMRRNKEVELEQEFSEWKTLIVHPLQIQPLFFSEQRTKGITQLTNHISFLSAQKGFHLKDSPNFPLTWPVAKKLKFLHFIAACLPLIKQKAEYDWKEIGASYYKEIGGSKVFDSYKNEFIDQLEEWAECPVNFLGMTSFGRITPLYFSGQLSGRYSSFQYGPVHALTDLAVLEDEYTTESTCLWIVENRAVLTKMAASKNYLKENKSFVLCVDGHLRSAHKNCIKQLLENSRIEQVIIWSDYDRAGYHIAKEMFVTVSQHFSGSIKWISPEQKVISEWKDYEAYMERFFEHHEKEQEEVLGGEREWNRWINH